MFNLQNVIAFFPHVQNLKNNCLKTIITYWSLYKYYFAGISISCSLELLAVIQIYNTGTYCSELFFSWHKYGNMVLLSFCLAPCACSCCLEFHVRKWFSCKWSKYEKVIMQNAVATVFQLTGILFSLWSSNHVFS
jgi:hypothetical protein